MSIIRIIRQLQHVTLITIDLKGRTSRSFSFAWHLWLSKMPFWRTWRQNPAPLRLVMEVFSVRDSSLKS